jgi:5-methylcytosine-specific restriction endonuclease McrA
MRRRGAEWRAKNSEKEKMRQRAYYETNRDVVKARSADRAKADPEGTREYKARWREANRERERSYSVAWRARHPEKRKRVIKGWEQRNPDKVRALRQNRRARVQQATGKFSLGLVKRLFKLQQGRCACCGLPLGLKYELDHIMPLALGGANEDSNAQLLRATCNRRKAARHPVDYMQSKGMLL